MLSSCPVRQRRDVAADFPERENSFRNGSDLGILVGAAGFEYRITAGDDDCADLFMNHDLPVQGKADSIRTAVREAYGQIAADDAGNCCGSSGTGCCDPGRMATTSAFDLGYSAADMADLPVGADLGLGCGNPQAIASLREGETVLDLGSGAGFDCFLAARSVGDRGRVIGVDMTPEMLAKARRNAAKAGNKNIEFRLGEIEALPVGDNTVDVIISNCVINLSPDKPRVFREAMRVLKPGGRLAIADMVRTAELPPEIANDLAAHCGCVAGAASIAELNAILSETGFVNIRIRPKDSSREFIRFWVPGRNAADYVVSSTIEAERR
jgi:arsenite methyltransferase